MISILLVIHVLAAIAIVVLVLLQQGRGADMGAAFGGGGGSQTLFGARGSANFLTRITGLLAGVFFFTSLSLAYLYGQSTEPQSVTDTPVQPTAPAKPAPEIPEVPDAPPDQSNPSEVPSIPGKSDAQSTGSAAGTDAPPAK